MAGGRSLHNEGPTTAQVQFIHLFKNWYSTSSRKLLRGAPNSSTVNKNSFQLIIECVRKCPR